MPSNPELLKQIEATLGTAPHFGLRGVSIMTQ